MTTIVTRIGKGSELTFVEVDANFTNLNTDKAESLTEGSFSSSRYVITTLGDQVLDSFPYTQYGAAKYIIYATLGLERQISELLLLQDSSTVQTVEYANLVTSSLLGQYTASIASGAVNIIVTPTTVGTSFQLIRTLINN